MEIAATCILPGSNRGQLLSTHQPISFWGCVDPVTGNISDRRHELFGESISEKVLVFPFGKGSSTGSLMILELLVVGKHFYGKTFPIVNVAEPDFKLLKTGIYAEIVSQKKGSYVRI
jgi:predicted aconitase with swiveling domain